MTDPLGLIGGSGAITPNISQRPAALGKDVPDFKQVLMENIEQVNQLQQDAEAAVEDLVAGRRDDVAGVMIAKQKADLAFKMLLQVRNKLVEAYQEIKDIRV